LPNILKNLKQKILPPVELGWYNRLKSNHFKHYDSVCLEFATMMGLDPWLINPLFLHCGDIDFSQAKPQPCLTQKVEELFGAITAKYKEYNIEHKPYIVVKSDAGTYGMAVMTVKHLDEILSLNRKQRSRMGASKGGQPVTKVIIQEGVYSVETWNGSVAEPVVYTMGQHVVGGFYRVHKDRGFDENLNAPGMHFEALKFEKSCNHPDRKIDEICHNRFYAYGVIARLSLLAAAREQQEYIV
jgi:glutamate--cysteine ligase